MADLKIPKEIKTLDYNKSMRTITEIDLKIEQGSALDYESLGLTDIRPVIDGQFVRVNSNGKYTIDGEPIRFRATNAPSGASLLGEPPRDDSSNQPDALTDPLSLHYHKPATEDTPITMTDYITQLKRQGYNAVRYHFPETYVHAHLAPYNNPYMNFHHPEFHTCNTAEEVLAMAREFDPKCNGEGKHTCRILYFFKLISELRKAGIRIIVDAWSSPIGLEPYGESGLEFENSDRWTASSTKTGYKSRLYFEQEVRNKWSRTVDILWNSINPFTNKTLLQDEALVSVTGADENSLTQHDIHLCTDINNLPPLLEGSGYKEGVEYYSSYLVSKAKQWDEENSGVGKRYSTSVILDENVLEKDNNEQNKRFMEFVAYYYNDLFEFWRSELVSKGYVYPRTGESRILSGLNTGLDVASDINRHKYDTVMAHSYASHPYGGDSMNAYDTHMEFNRISVMSSLSNSGDQKNLNWLGMLCAENIKGKPFFVEEYNHAYWSPYRHEESVTMTAVASINDWDGLLQYSHYGSVLSLEKVGQTGLHGDRLTPFIMATDPIQRVNQAVAGLVWSNRYIPEGVSINPVHFVHPEHPRYALDVTLQNTAAHRYNTDPFKKLGLTYKVEMEYRESRSSEIVEDVGEVNLEGNYSSTPTPTYGDVRRKLVSQNAISENNKSIDDQLYVNDDDTFRIDVVNGTAIVNVPKSKGGVFKKGINLCIDGLNVSDTTCNGSFMVMSLEDKPLSSSERMLVTFATDAVSTDTMFFNTHPDTIISETGTNTPTINQLNAGGYIVDLDETVDHPEYRQWPYSLGQFPPILENGSLKFSLMSNVVGLKLYALKLTGARREEIKLSYRFGRYSATLDTGKLTEPTVFFELVKG